MKPKPSSIGIACAGTGKPLEKVYTCTLASNTTHHTTTAAASNNIQIVQQHQRNNSLITSNMKSSGAGQTLPTTNTINTARLATTAIDGLINKPTVNLSAAVKRRREDEEST